MSQIMLNVIPAEINFLSVNDVTNGVVSSLPARKFSWVWKKYSPLKRHKK